MIFTHGFLQHRKGLNGPAVKPLLHPRITGLCLGAENPIPALYQSSSIKKMRLPIFPLYFYKDFGRVFSSASLFSPWYTWNPRTTHKSLFYGKEQEKWVIPMLPTFPKFASNSQFSCFNLSEWLAHAIIFIVIFQSSYFYHALAILNILHVCLFYYFLQQFFFFFVL